MTPSTTRKTAAEARAGNPPFGFLALQDRRPEPLPNVETEIRDLLAQRGKG